MDIHYFSGWASTTGDNYTVSNHWETPPIDCIVQTMIVGSFNWDDSWGAQVAITAVEYLDDDGVQRRNDYGPAPYSNANPVVTVFQKKLVRFDWAIRLLDARQTT